MKKRNKEKKPISVAHKIFSTGGSFQSARRKSEHQID